MNESLELIKESMPLLMQGASMSLQLWLSAVMISLSIGGLCGILQSNRLRTSSSVLLDWGTFVFRGVPFFVQLLIAYFVLPDIFGVDVPVFVAASCSLGLCSAAYVSQIVRTGINSVPVGQWEAAMVLGYSTFQAVRFIIPQMLRNVLPAIIGECDQLLKSTAIVSSIGVLELTGAAKNIVAREMHPITMYLAIALIYLAMSSVLLLLANIIERRLYRDTSR
jgi:polar amino acid transport system permease protein